MRKKQMQDVLAEFVANCGYDTVRRALMGLRPANMANVPKRGNDSSAKRQAKSRPPKTAVAVVESLEAEGEHKRMLMVLAEKYDAKTFIPHVASARGFLEMEGVDVSRVKSRQQVTVSVFKRLANWDTERLREMDSGGWYAAHRGLAPIAEAIENFGRRRRGEVNPNNNTAPESKNP